MKIAAVMGLLGPLMQDDKLLHILVSYGDEPQNTRPLWLVDFHHELAHVIYTVQGAPASFCGDPNSSHLVEGWVDPSEWTALMLAPAEFGFQHLTRDELVVKIRTEDKVRAANQSDHPLAAIFKLAHEAGAKVEIGHRGGNEGGGNTQQ